MAETVSKTYIYRHYRSGAWCPYQTIIHTAKDKLSDIRLPNGIVEALDLRSGDVITITVTKTAMRNKTVWELKANAYRPTKKPKSKGCPQCQSEDNLQIPPESE